MFHRDKLDLKQKTSYKQTKEKKIQQKKRKACVSINEFSFRNSR